jgi:MFS family permease
MDRVSAAAPDAATRNAPPRRSIALTLVVLAAGVSVALHVGKLPPAVPALRQALGISLVQAGFLLSMVQVAGMTLGLVLGLVTDALGLRRTMLIGLLMLASASGLGAAVPAGPHALTLLMGLRLIEGIGFLLAVMPAPALMRALAPHGTEKLMFGLWGAYMPMGVALALLLGPECIGWLGWRGWWLLLSAFAACAALAVWLYLPAFPPHAAVSRGPGGGTSFLHAWLAGLRQTLGARAPRALGLCFAVYSAQWMAVIGFLPAIYAEAGLAAGSMAVLTAGAAAVNIVGNVLGGHLLQRGLAPQRLLRWSFAAMALGALAAYAQIPVGPGLRYLAVCAFSLGGGMVPATLFMLGVRLAPAPALVSTTVGLMQQTSSLGQFLAPPLVAWLANQTGGWQWTWVATGACALTGIAVAGRLGTLWRLTQEGDSP